MRLEGAKDLIRNLDKIGVDGEKAIQDAVNNTAIDVHNTAVKSIQKKGKGEVYDITFFTKNGKSIPAGLRTGQNLSATHQASKPGDPPASDTGTGANSIKFKFGKLSAVVWTDQKYMAWLEFGTRRIEARPWLLPSLKINEKKFRKRIDKLIEKATRRVDND